MANRDVASITTIEGLRHEAMRRQDDKCELQRRAEEERVNAQTDIILQHYQRQVNTIDNERWIKSMQKALEHEMKTTDGYIVINRASDDDERIYVILVLLFAIC